MRPLLYHIIACCAVLFFTACDKEYDILDSNATGDGNSIILDLEDAVSPAEKDSARILVRNALKNLLQMLH